MGSVCSILLVIIICGYIAHKSASFDNESQILTETVDSHFDPSFVFGHEQGFNFAFGLTEYSNSPESIDNASYGSLKAYQYYWGDDSLRSS